MKFDTVDFVKTTMSPWPRTDTLATESKGHSTVHLGHFGRQKLPTFDTVDRVKHV